MHKEMTIRQSGCPSTWCVESSCCPTRKLKSHFVPSMTQRKIKAGSITMEVSIKRLIILTKGIPLLRTGCKVWVDWEQMYQPPPPPHHYCDRSIPRIGGSHGIIRTNKAPEPCLTVCLFWTSIKLRLKSQETFGKNNTQPVLLSLRVTKN